MSSVLTLQGLSASTGLSRHALLQAVNDGMPCIAAPKQKGGQWQFELKACVQWLINRHKSGAAVSHAEAKRRKAVAEAELAILKLARQKGELLNSDDVVGAWQGALSRFRVLMLGLPATVAEECVIRARDGEPAVREYLKERIKHALAELSRVKFEGDQDDDEDDLDIAT